MQVHSCHLINVLLKDNGQAQQAGCSVTNATIQSLQLSRLGYYAWKPLVICKALSQVEPGSMLLFMDANLQKYQEGMQDVLGVYV